MEQTTKVSEAAAHICEYSSDQTKPNKTWTQIPTPIYHIVFVELMIMGVKWGWRDASN